MGGSLNNFKYRKTTGNGRSWYDLIHRSGSSILGYRCDAGRDLFVHPWHAPFHPLALRRGGTGMATYS